MGGMTAAVAASALPGARSVSVSDVNSMMQKEERVGITPSFPACSTAKENCMQSGCCQVSGHTCFRKNEHMAFCNETCSPLKGALCSVPHVHSVPVQTVLDDTLYCFSVYTKNTGNTKPNYELDIIREQFNRKLSIFACDQSDVFSDVEVEVGQGLNTIMVE